VAMNSGADIVKLHAFKAEDVDGIMPQGFYKKCEFTFQQYLELINYGIDIGIDVFYTIFSTELNSLRHAQKWQKWESEQLQKHYTTIKKDDNYNVFIGLKDRGLKPEMKNAKMMHVSDCLTETPLLDQIEFLSEYYGRPVGYSDHTLGICNCMDAVNNYGAIFIEKHLTMTRNIYYNGKQYKDAIHSALPWEMESLAREIKGGIH